MNVDLNVAHHKLQSRYIGSVPVHRVTYLELTEIIFQAITTKKQCCITYANAHSILLAEETTAIRETYKHFAVVHPDGIGVFLASQFLYNKQGFEERITGSDYYSELLAQLHKKENSLFLFGDTEETLATAKKRIPAGMVKGCISGFRFDTETVIEEINNVSPDVLFVGLGSPLQEIWVVQNRDRLEVPVIICCGEGIKIFAETKVRGPVWMRLIGFEWLARLLAAPGLYARRYLLGIPQFVRLILSQKFNQ